MDPRSLGLYIITDRRQTIDRPLERVIQQALAGGARFFQLREKDLSARELYTLGERLSLLIRSQGGFLLINDRIDVALALEADGVHLPQKGLTANQARKLLGSHKLIGVSAHTWEEALKAQEDGADFITFGPVFRTPSKARYGEPVGLNSLQKISKFLNIPLLALGGVKVENALSCLEAGADGLAVISAVLAAPDVTEVVKSFLKTLFEKRVQKSHPPI